MQKGLGIRGSDGNHFGEEIVVTKDKRTSWFDSPRNMALALIAIGLIYVFLISPYLALPPLGKHAQNEALYLSFIHSLRFGSDPFIFYPAYDTERPDFNVGYLYFWVSFLWAKAIGFLGFPDIVVTRSLSVLSTILLLPVLYGLLSLLGFQNRSIAISLAIIAFSPFVLYFGWKAQLEPFVILVFAASQLLLVRYIKDRTRMRDLIISSFVLGALIATRLNFILFIPVVIAPAIAELIRGGRGKAAMLAIIPAVAMFGGVILTILPVQLIHPETSPANFMLIRAVNASGYANVIGDSRIMDVLMTFFVDGLWKQTILLFPLVLIALPIILKWKTDDCVRIYIGILAVMTLIFFFFTYPHDSNHTYQLYYGLVFASIAVCLSIEHFQGLFKNHDVWMLVAIMLLIAQFYFALSYSYSFFGLFNRNDFEGVDAFGTMESYQVGSAIKTILDEAGNPSGYSLVQSSVVYYPIQYPSITYYELFRFNYSTGSYTGYSIFWDKPGFLNEIKRRKLNILTMTPDVGTQDFDGFKAYRNDRFFLGCSTKSFQIYLSKDLFSNESIAQEKCAMAIAGAKDAMPG